MKIPRDAVLLRVFFGEDDKFEKLPLYEAIVLKAREMHLAGATVLRGAAGFGHSSRIHTTKILRLSQDLPIVVEIVDEKEKIELFPAGARPNDIERPRDHRKGASPAIRRTGRRRLKRPIAPDGQFRPRLRRIEIAPAGVLA